MAGNMTSANTKRKFNLFDAFILIFAVLAIVAIAYVLSGKASPTKIAVKTTHVTYQVEINGVIAELKNSAQVGDTVRDGVKRVNIGTITGVDVKPFTAQVPNLEENGKFNTAVVGDRSTVVLTIEADANESSGRYAVNGSTLGIGTLMYIQSKHFAGEGYCIGLAANENP
jgi:hypothetical protein